MSETLANPFLGTVAAKSSATVAQTVIAPKGNLVLNGYTNPNYKESIGRDDFEIMDSGSFLYMRETYGLTVKSAGLTKGKGLPYVSVLSEGRRGIFTAHLVGKAAKDQAIVDTFAALGTEEEIAFAALNMFQFAAVRVDATAARLDANKSAVLDEDGKAIYDKITDEAGNIVKVINFMLMKKSKTITFDDSLFDA